MVNVPEPVLTRCNADELLRSLSTPSAIDEFTPSLTSKSNKVNLKGKTASLEKEVAQSILDKTARAQSSSITKADNTTNDK